jgi:hypothetical protein
MEPQNKRRTIIEELEEECKEVSEGLNSFLDEEL